MSLYQHILAQHIADTTGHPLRPPLLSRVWRFLRSF